MMSKQAFPKLGMWFCGLLLVLRIVDFNIGHEEDEKLYKCYSEYLRCRGDYHFKVRVC